MNFPCGHPRTPENSYRFRGSCAPYCRTCDLERTRRYRQKRPDYNRLYLRRWRKGIRACRDRLTLAWPVQQ